VFCFTSFNVVYFNGYYPQPVRVSLRYHTVSPQDLSEYPPTFV
jgi:hypothetical protein